MAEAVRLIVWDMDESFWRGTLSEGGVTWRDDTHAIVVELARRGIMSSICSKNDFDAARAVLAEHGAWDYFIFPSIDWSPTPTQPLDLSP
jgi:predicted enzyme involved in methoxymalonyl-ACP biosynthesis